MAKMTRLAQWMSEGRRRKLALAIVLLAQTVFFFHFLDRPVRTLSDNIRYETAGFNLVQGRGIALPLSMTGDPLVYSWVCSRHPQACLPDGTHPTAIYPPGYSVMLAGVYAIAGRSVAVVAGVQLVLLWLLFIMFERLANRFLNRRGYWFAMAVACTYPFIARQAGMIMSDMFHITTFVGALGALLLLRPGIWRGVCFGALMAITTLTRPYSLLVFPVLWLWPTVRRAVAASWREWIVAAVVFIVPFGAWTARNAYWFGHFVPLTTFKLGGSFLATTYEADFDGFSRGGDKQFYKNLTTKLGDNYAATDVDERAVQEARSRIMANPATFIWRMIVHVPRNWVSLGYSGKSLSRGWLLLVFYLGGLMVLGVIGMWLKRKDAMWHAIILSILVYWMMIIPFAPEARRTLPLRLPMLMLAGVTISQAIAWWLKRQQIKGVGVKTSSNVGVAP